jgi:hypothetical protein
MASARAAGVLKGNQNRRRRRGSLQEGAPRPSLGGKMLGERREEDVPSLIAGVRGLVDQQL